MLHRSGTRLAGASTPEVGPRTACRRGRPAKRRGVQGTMRRLPAPYRQPLRAWPLLCRQWTTPAQLYDTILIIN